jgi:hypothetical protein
MTDNSNRDIFLWIFLHASLDALADEEVQDALVSIVISCPLESAPSICTALLRRIEPFDEAKQDISGVNIALALWTSILRESTQADVRKTYKEIAFKSTSMMRLFTTIEIPESTHEGMNFIAFYFLYMLIHRYQLFQTSSSQDLMQLTSGTIILLKNNVLIG